MKKGALIFASVKKESAGSVTGKRAEG